jgi:hypothetical protein
MPKSEKFMGKQKILKANEQAPEGVGSPIKQKTYLKIL